MTQYEDKETRKHGKVRSVVELKPGAIVNFNDFQVCASNADGSIHMVNMDIHEPKPEGPQNENYRIVPGAWRITPRQGIQPIQFSENVYFETETSAKLSKIFNTFKNRLHVYDELELQKKKRAILLGSKPGCGKSALINHFCKTLLKEKNACVLFIDNQNVDFETVQTMFRTADKNAVDFIVLVIEDIGGNDLNSRRQNVDSTLLNFLDGADGVYHIPTLVVGTTNFLDELSETLTDRPGRFDVVETVQPPKDEDTIFLAESFIKRHLTQSEKEAVTGKGFTPAYLRECVIRHKLDDITMEEAVSQLQAQRKENTKKKKDR